MPTGVYCRTKEHLLILAKARASIEHKPLSEKTKRKISIANRGIWIKYKCDYCGKENEEKQSNYNKSKRHFCNGTCYSKFCKELLPLKEHNAWKGGRNAAYKRYCKRNPERIRHLKAREYARKRDAEGSHTLEEWAELKRKYNNRCAICGKKKPLTKDHIIPLSDSGTDYISNIQPLCRNCNSQKWKHRTRLF